MNSWDRYIIYIDGGDEKSGGRYYNTGLRYLRPRYSDCGMGDLCLGME